MRSHDFEVVKTLISFNLTDGRHCTAWSLDSREDVIAAIEQAMVDGRPSLTYASVTGKPAHIVAVDDIIAVKVDDYRPELDRRA